MKRDLPSFLLYALGFMLLWEWLRPVEQLTDTNHIEMFVIFILISFGLSFLKLKWIWKTIIKLWFISFSINKLHYDEGIFQFGWLSSFFNALIGDVSILIARDWQNLSNEIRTLMFFILLWLMVYLIQFWLLNRQRIFIFFFMTLIYITVLDTFTLYNATTAIVRTVIVGFAVMGMLTYYRILLKENVNNEYLIIRKWMRPLAIMIGLSVLVGIAAPKFAPIWPDPVPFLKAAGDKGGEDAGSGGVSKVAYGTDHTQLGGPFIGDDSVVFRSEATGKNYWKVETKDTYTSKGWIVSSSTLSQFSPDELVPVSAIPANVETATQTANLFMFMDYDHLIYPAGIQRVRMQQSNNLEIDFPKEKITIMDFNGSPATPESYTVEYKVPKYKASDLRLTVSANPQEVGLEFIDQYTQLPTELPDRVKELAQSITEGKTNWFDKAKAVESYFGSNGFTYNQTDVAVPGAEDDYVDQFLFDTKTGYCDNYSTSMVVLLRTLGIPARWVKGYTGGTFLNYSDNSASTQVYEITNNNAHSWVEVYFPNQGWVPFEPTQGFTNDVSISFLNEDGTPPSTETTAPPVKQNKPKEDQDSSNSKNNGWSFTVKGIWLDIKLFFSAYYKIILLLIVIVGGGAGILYRLRGKWIPRIYLLRYRFRKKDESIGEAYLILLEQLKRFGLGREEHQTLRNYARYIDTFFSTREMTRLTALYEQYLYHQHLPKGSWKDSRELWENLIKKTIA